MTDFERLLEALSGAGVEFILVGGVAAPVHGSVRLTEDIDVVYARARENLERLVAALAAHGPYPKDLDAISELLAILGETSAGDPSTGTKR